MQLLFIISQGIYLSTELCLIYNWIRHQMKQSLVLHPSVDHEHSAALPLCIRCDWLKRVRENESNFHYSIALHLSLWCIFIHDSGSLLNNVLQRLNYQSLSALHSCHPNATNVQQVFFVTVQNWFQFFSYFFVRPKFLGAIWNIWNLKSCFFSTVPFLFLWQIVKLWCEPFKQQTPIERVKEVKIRDKKKQNERRECISMKFVVHFRQKHVHEGDD